MDPSVRRDCLGCSASVASFPHFKGAFMVGHDTNIFSPHFEKTFSNVVPLGAVVEIEALGQIMSVWFVLVLFDKLLQY